MFNCIDWEDQWAHNAPLFKKGRAVIPLGNNFFELLPGPGFGDFSHPTTQLMLDIMTPYVEGRTVFDIGCGSGILSIAAKKLGAKEVYCSDIDPEALAHTKKNALHNDLSLLLSRPKNPQVILMNMIESEQKVAWQNQGSPFEHLITSGILAADENRYLHFANEQGWHLMKKYRKNDWAGFVFSHGDLKNES